MSLEREYFNAPITFTCDGHACDEIDETQCMEFSGALAKLKSHGWTVRKNPKTDEWEHLCRVCQ